MPRSKLARRKKTAYPLRQTNSNVGAKPNDLFAAAVAHHQGGRLAEAESLYKLIIGENPNHYMGLNNLGLIDANRGRNAEAEVFYRRALAINDNYAEPLINLANLYHARKKFAEATLLYQKALQIDPDSVAAHVNFGNLLRDQGNYQEAAANYNRALALNPDIVEAHLNLGNILVALGDLGAAIDKYRVVINMRPESADAYTNLGATLLQIGKIDEARAALEHALQLEPDKVDALLNLGNVFVALGQTDESVRCCQRILEINPDHAGAQANVLAALNYCDSITPEEVAQQCLRIGEMVERRFRTIRPVHGNIPDPDRRLRIGYVSPDFRKHAVAYFLEPLFSHDRRLVEIFCYAEVVAPDHITERFMSVSDHWLSTLGVSDEDLAERIRQDGIDILIDLAGHTENTRLPVFARRPAPVQMTWLGYPNTTGFHSIDYRLVDAYTDPPGRADHLASETLLRINGGFLCYHPLQEAPPPAPPPCLDNGFVTFGSFNKLAKISSAALDLWGRLLVRVPTARLLLKSHFFAADDSKARFLALLDKRGVAPDRVILVGPSAASADQLRAYHQVDIALDSFPYNGTTTTCEALWMGVPVVALAGESHCGRTGVSLLTQVGVAELIAHDQDDYIRIAADLAEDTARLTALHARLRGLMAASPFCDAPAFARKLEAVYRTTWRRWCETRSPKHEDEAPEQSAQVDAPTESRSFPLRLSDGSVLALPASLDCITTYIVLEQEIWFEKEAGFPSQWLKPGMTAIDIGAHVGVYSLPMARAVGPSGRVVAYEPSRAIVELLKQSQELNDATCLSVVQAALSDRRRAGHLVHADCSELNRLGETGEPVTVSCLDHEDLVQNWNTPDFVKIDAAGEEASILRGGNAFFTRHSPLVMFAASSDADVRLPLCEAFYALGYRIYRLLAGAPVLVPDTGATLDAYEINLFAAKPDRAASLAQDGWLAEDLPTWHPTDRDRQQALEPLRQRPCAVAFADLLRHDLLIDPTYRDGLAAFTAWRSPALPLPTRCAALEFAWQSLMTLNQQAATHARLLTLARVAWEAGRRALCVQALRHFLTQLGTSPLQLNEPFWPPAAGFDLLKPVGPVPEWVIGSATEQLERSGHHSSGYTGQAAGAEWLCTHSFGSAEMERRRMLVRARAGQRMEIPERLCVESEDHLNAPFWRTGGVPNTVVATMGNPAPADRRQTSRLHGTGSDKRIVVDGHYFRFAGGIARAWTEILAQLQDTALGRRIVLLDRGFVPGQLNRLETTRCPPLDYDRWQDDRRIVQELCDELDAALFISTYYTRPERTPSLLMVYDMIPERNGFNLSEPQWQQKHDAINYAAAYTAISENTRTDLLHYHPAAAGKPLIVNYLGVSSAFHASEASDKQRFFQQFVVPKLAGRPYIMFVGGYPTYKNNGLLFAALSRIDCSGLALLMTAGIELVDKFRQILFRDSSDGRSATGADGRLNWPRLGLARA